MWLGPQASGSLRNACVVSETDREGERRREGGRERGPGAGHMELGVKGLGMGRGRRDARWWYWRRRVQGVRGIGSGTLVVVGGPWEVTCSRVLSVHGNAVVSAGV